MMWVASRCGHYAAMHVYSAPVIRRALNVSVKSIAQPDWFNADPNRDTNGDSPDGPNASPILNWSEAQI